MEFKDIVNNLDESLNNLLSKLEKSSYIERKEIPNINGIYVFYENEEPVYVGRTNKNRMRERIMEHSRKSSNKNSATFAFLILKDNFSEIINNIDTYDKDFLKAKEKVLKMKVRIIEINDPIIQTIIEPFIAYKLGTIKKYNKFITH